MEKQFFHHALKIVEDACIGCSLCMRVCPTEALRIKDGKAHLIEDRCVDCGECYRKCPVHAIIIEQDDINRIFEYKHRVALVPAVIHGQFEKEVSMNEISTILKSMGFTWIYEAEHGAGVLKPAIEKLIADPDSPKPLISTYCPAVVRLIQVKFPSLTKNFAYVKAPLEMSAYYCRRVLRDMGYHNSEIGVFYVTPCAAKIAAVKAPVGDESSQITGVINMDLLFNRISKTLRNKAEYLSAEQSAVTLSPASMLWSLTNGEAVNIKGNSMAIDGMNNVIDFLEKLENDEITNVDFLELRACDEGCAGGVLLSSNRFLVAERLRNKAKNIISANPRSKGDSTPPIEAYFDYLMGKVKIMDEIKPRSMYSFSDNLEEAMKMMQKSRHLMCFLPGTDCGMCGAPGCQTLAEDIARHRANVSDCVFIRQTMEEKGKLHPDTSIRIMKKIWGNQNFEKNCFKKGAENESN